MTDNIFIGGKQYNECYLRKCIKPCRVQFNTNKPKAINPVLVRSTEAMEGQEISRRVRNLEVKTMQIGIKLNQKLESLNNNNNEVNTEFSKINCKKPMRPAVLQKSLAAMKYMNYSARISNLFKKANQFARILDISKEINNIKITTRYQEGIKRYDLCINMNILNKRLNLINQSIDNL